MQPTYERMGEVLNNYSFSTGRMDSSSALIQCSTWLIGTKGQRVYQIKGVDPIADGVDVQKDLCINFIKDEITIYSLHYECQISFKQREIFEDWAKYKQRTEEK